jgi:BirA family biotin operon repressor/biotin-[acetyl-CoA-carboxylase] ligase
LSSPTSSLFIGKPTYTFDELDSTNKYATLILSKSKPSEGTVIKACFQTDGMGQIGRTWQSEPNKNLLCSIILFPKFLSANAQFLLSMAISVGICEAIQPFLQERICIKWPNDIYIGKKKVGGILIQNSLGGNLISNCIVGIGININQSNFPDELPNPISISRQIGKEIDINAFEQSLYSHIEYFYLMLKRGKHEKLQQKYLERLFWKDKVHSFEDEKGKIFSGIIRGIDVSGKLLIEKEEGIHSFAFRSIKFML